MSCPYRGCHGERAHPTPHLFEATDIERFEREARERAVTRSRVKAAMTRLLDRWGYIDVNDTRAYGEADVEVSTEVAELITELTRELRAE